MGINSKKQYEEKFDEQVTRLPVIPTIDVVVFPNQVVPLLVLDEKIIKGVEHAQQTSNKMLLLAARQQSEGYQGPIGIQDLYKIGTVSNIMRVMNLPEGGIKILTQGLYRASVHEIISDHDQLQAEIEPFAAGQLCYDPERAALQMRDLLQVVDRLAACGRIFSQDFQVIVNQIQDPEKITDFILSHLNLHVAIAQELLEKESLNAQLESLHAYLHHELELSSTQEKIKSNTRESINKSQREYYLREQIKAIQRELGDDVDNELDDLRQKLHELPLPEEARSEGMRQFKRLEKTAPDSMEASVIRTHLEWLLNMPWGTYTKDSNDIKKAKEILESHHYGLRDVKDRILDFLSIRFLKEDCYAPILCLLGPPGVGKTSLGQSIAETLGRRYSRISLGGVYDESEIRGHRRTYVGALPGRFIQAIKRSGSCNPLLIIDEIDKIGMSNRGDPSAALLEVLDPEQNSLFYDNYLGVHFDLSKVMFVATANDITNIPGPLRDRMEIIHIAGYTLEEKMAIARHHLIGKAIKNSGLDKTSFAVNDEIINEIICGYTRESGVRELDRQIQKLCSKYARSLVENNQQITFERELLHKHLGPRRVSFEQLVKINKIGVSNGLAWTPFGGELLQVEAVLMPGSGKLLLTGQLGEIMKESAQAAVTYAKSHAAMFSINPSMFTDYDIHIHLPAGAIPKDGPSAGITLLTAVLSAFTHRQINSSYAMTGELNLQGSVLPIGGLKEKILAAKQHGLSHVIIPKLNEKDMVELEDISSGLDIVYVENVDEVLDHVLLPADIVS